ncbi:MAG: hypothetical protein JXA38_08160 [Methanosarcinaceae archaeon]|nr:hypothetical protein [Methanosarcinaceae archaeon]
MDYDNDAKIKKISRLLELGGTMLADHCNTCGAPMFRYHGKVVCPVCDSKIQPVQPIEPSPQVTEPKLGSTLTQKVVAPIPVTGEEIVSLEDIILKKMTGIAQLMQEENDTRRIFEYLEVIERGLDIIERLKKKL